ncbi:serine/threonine-protein kinase [Glycomyces terrestris]|uniref:non-specific serine/threonine protein kinase n=1 Tax=Glycomyces terrestris TaxID=2493553 RepID=A0A426UVP3_9ACTN|nr:serine/threonine-protein kinase [Glycomyces terrestris]RRR98241.1 serine/threonine protein kinase [Glycomyces terrestris]
MDETTDPFARIRERLAELLPGYRLDPEPVSSTAQSQVFLAEDLRLHRRKVAVKVMAGYLSMHPGYRERFLREIQLTAGLEHPNVMYVITAAAPGDDLLFLVMPRAEDDLRRRLDRGPLDLAQTVDVVVQVARALDFAHDRGVVHRDVKPGNILFGPGGHVYLGDFGVAKGRGGKDLTVLGEYIGTRRYTAPEVFNAGAAERPAGAPEGAPATALERAGDVYSLGAVLYHCLAGRRPLDDLDDSGAEQAQRAGDIGPVTAVRSDLPAAVDAVVAKAMHVDPAQRYGTCGELAHDLAQTVGVTEAGSALPILRDIQERLRTEARPGPAAAAAPRPALLSLLTALVALVLLAGVLLYTALGPDGGDGAGELAAGESASEEGPEPTAPPPVTGDEQVERRPVEGECATDDPDVFIVVACDSPLAAEYYYRIVVNPEDPNPSQPDHTDAAWLACGADGVTDFEYHWWDTADEEDVPWDPETGVVYYIMCYQELE